MKSGGRRNLVLWALFLVINARCASAVYSRPEPSLSALESRLTRPAADTDLARRYVARAAAADELERARDFFSVMTLRKPQEPLYPFGEGLVLRAQQEREAAKSSLQQAVEVASRPEVEESRGD